MVIFPNNEVRLEYDNTYDRQMVEIVEKITGDYMLLVNPIDNDAEELYGIKPYIKYSCRYVYPSDVANPTIDVVITYALDNYITVQGKIGDEFINKSGIIRVFSKPEINILEFSKIIFKVSYFSVKVNKILINSIYLSSFIFNISVLVNIFKTTLSISSLSAYTNGTSAVTKQLTLCPFFFISIASFS